MVEAADNHFKAARVQGGFPLFFSFLPGYGDLEIPSLRLCSLQVVEGVDLRGGYPLVSLGDFDSQTRKGGKRHSMIPGDLLSMLERFLDILS